MPDYSYFISLKDYFVDTVKDAVQQSNLHICRGHCFELIAAFFGFNTYAALKVNGFLSKDKYQNEPTVDLKKLTERASSLQISNDVLDVVEDCLMSLHSDEQNYLISLTKRLARNVKHNSYLSDTSIDPIFEGSVFLDEEDWKNCGDIASRNHFKDYLFTITPWPTIATIVAVHNYSIDGFYQINPDSVLNIIEFLDPNEIQKLLHEMRTR
ncbi:hypothetical protein [Acinetobacter calcoaceticus]|uniref:hypothetical protein n=1 Tax=Acinetobacter calcoaceticus TaxID=471 RepID=UPI00124D592A|nr:hypothetical protein [Acinetobacter calcoaceticus]